LTACGNALKTRLDYKCKLRRGPNVRVPVYESSCAPDMPMLPFHTLDVVHKGDRHARTPGAATERSTQPPGPYNTDSGRDRAHSV
jgi:hypothetical protein